MDLKLFVSTFALIFIAELPDKTSFATVLLATKKRPSALFVGVAAAFLVQSAVGVSFGSALSLLPLSSVQIGSGLLFLLFAVLMWIRKDSEENGVVDDQKGNSKNSSSNFWPTVYSSFVIIFMAEWGDLTQLTTATLVAKYKSPFTIFSASVLALWAVTLIAIAVGNRARAFIKPKLLKQIASIAFGTAGAIILFNALWR